MGLLNLFVVALMPVLKLLLITALGVFLTVERIDLLGADARNHINNLVFFVLNPALVGSNLAKYITFGSMLKLWFMPVSVLINFMVGSVLGLLVIKAAKPPKALQGVIFGCCAAANLGNMPLIIIPAVCKEESSPFGDANLCNARGLAYATLSMAVGSVYMWTYVFNIVRIYSSNKGSHDQSRTDIALAENGESVVGETTANLSKGRTGPLLPVREPSVLDVGHPMERFDLNRPVSEEKAEVPSPENTKQRFLKFIKKLHLKRYFSPTIIAAIVGLVVGSVPPFRKSLIGDSAPLRVAEDSMFLVGEAAIPISTLIVGANLLKGLKGSKVPLSVIISTVAVRYMIMPILGVIIIKSAAHFGLVHSDPLYQFVLLLQFALPPAINIGTMAQLFGAGETECSVIMLWTNGLATVSLTLWSAFFMWLVR